MTPLRQSPIDMQRVAKVFFVVALAGLMLTYTYYQARNLINGPSIVLSGDLPVLQHEKTVTLTGRAKNITSLTLNGKAVYTDESGSFSRVLVLENGYTIMTLEARDRYGRTASLTRGFVYKGEQSNLTDNS